MTLCVDCGVREATLIAALTEDDQWIGADLLTADRLAHLADYPTHSRLLCGLCAATRAGFRWAVVHDDGSVEGYEHKHGAAAATSARPDTRIVQL